MPLRMKAGTTKIVAASIVVGMLAFVALIVPEHLAEPAHHDHCEVCQFIQHTPLLEPEAVTDIAPLLQLEGLPFISDDTASPCPQLKSPLSRAPPLS